MSKKYLTFEAIDDVTFTFTKNTTSSLYLTQDKMTSISYSTDDGETWTTLTNNGTSTSQTLTTPTITAGSKVLWKGTALQLSMNNVGTQCSFDSSGRYKVYGNVMSLLYGDDFLDKTSFSEGSQYTFHGLFSMANIDSKTNLQSIENLVLPATTLVANCYATMFEYNTAITKTPLIINATTAANCYNGMFYSCSSLNYVNTLMESDFTTPVQGLYTNNWLTGVARTGTFIKHPNATFPTDSPNGIPSGWTVKPARV